MSDAPSSSNHLDLLDSLISTAKKAGADAADALYSQGRSIAVSWRDGALEDIDGSEGADIGLRVFIGQQQAVASTSDHSAKSLATLVDRTLAMAKAVPADPYCGLAPEDHLFKGETDGLDLYDPTLPSADDLKAMAREADETARAIDGITNTDGGSASSGHYDVAFITSHGFKGAYSASSFSVSVSTHGEKDGAMERDYDYSSGRHLKDLDSPVAVAKSAADRTLKRLGASKLESGKMPVVFDPRVSNGLVGHLLGAINGTSVAMGTSFLMDMRDKAVFKEGVTIFDDPAIVRGLKSRYFDGEGVSVTKKSLIDKGVLTGWLLNSATAKQLGENVTGHASRGTGAPPGISTSNVYMAAGALSPAGLIADIKDGLYVTELIGMGVNGVTGDYSRGAAGFRIKNGVLAESVSEVTIASNLKDMFQMLTPADDLDFKYGINAPTLRIDEMMIAGN